MPELQCKILPEYFWYAIDPGYSRNICPKAPFLFGHKCNGEEGDARASGTLLFRAVLLPGMLTGPVCCAGVSDYRHTLRHGLTSRSAERGCWGFISRLWVCLCHTKLSKLCRAAGSAAGSAPLPSSFRAHVFQRVQGQGGSSSHSNRAAPGLNCAREEKFVHTSTGLFISLVHCKEKRTS